MYFQNVKSIALCVGIPLSVMNAHMDTFSMKRQSVKVSQTHEHQSHARLFIIFKN